MLTKEEVMKKFMVKDEGVLTTNQINTICKNITLLLPNREVHLYIDECWITVPKNYEAHFTPVRKIFSLIDDKSNLRRNPMMWLATFPS